MGAQLNYQELELLNKLFQLNQILNRDMGKRILPANLNQKATHEPSGQHILNEEYYDRIEAIQFTMNHDDGNQTENKHTNMKKFPNLIFGHGLGPFYFWIYGLTIFLP